MYHYVAQSQAMAPILQQDVAETKDKNKGAKDKCNVNQQVIVIILVCYNLLQTLQSKKQYMQLFLIKRFIGLFLIKTVPPFDRISSNGGTRFWFYLQGQPSLQTIQSAICYIPLTDSQPEILLMSFCTMSLMT